MNNPTFKHRNAYAINREDNSAEFDLYDIAGNVVDSFIVDLEDVGYIANYKWCKSQYGVENHKVKNLARFIAAQYIEDLKPTQSVIRIDERKLDYRKCNLRIGVTGSASKDSASRLATDAKKCEANGDYLHVYFAKKQNDATYYRAVIASNNLTVGKFCVSKSYNVNNNSRAREYAIYTAYLFEKEYYGGRVSDHEYARKEGELHPYAAACIKSCTHDYRGKVCLFTELEDFGIYEMTDGSYRDIINFDSPNVRPIYLESVIDFYQLGYNILEAGLKNVIYSDGWIYVLPDLK